MAFSFNFGYNQTRPITVERDSSNNIFYSLFNSSRGVANKISDANKLDKVMSNPALLKVVVLDCDIFSMGKINKYNDGKLIEKDFLYSLTPKPNFLQSWTQFNWDYKFWLDIYGKAYLYNPNGSTSLNENTSIQWLNPCKITWNDTYIKKLQTFIFSKKSYGEVMKGTFTYTFENGETKTIRLDELQVFHDLTNAGLANPLDGYSRIDALYKVINNSELTLDAKGINTFLSGRVMVSGTSDLENVSQMPMHENERLDIESKVMSNKNVHAVKSMIDIKRFVDNMANLKLDESFLSDYFIFGAMFNIPKDVLDITAKGSTYENQEKAMARLVEYAEAPKGQKLTDWIESQFDLQDIRMSWEHLSFMQVFEKEKNENYKVKAETLLLLMSAGVALEEINEMINTKFSKLDYEGLKSIKQTNTNDKK